MRFTKTRLGTAAATLCALALVAGLAVPAARAADQAREAVGLFVQSCLKHVEDPQDLLAWIDATPQLRRFAPKQAQAFLEGKKGDVWSAENDAGLFALVLFADNSCQVLAQQASADQVSLVFSEYVRRKGLPLNKIGDRRDYVRSIDERTETWRSASGFPYEVVVKTSKSPRADAQAVLTTLPNR